MNAFPNRIPAAGSVRDAMVAGLAFLATAVATLFAQSTLVRWSQARAAHQRVWAMALAMFALASVSLALGASTGWDGGVFRAFYLFGAILNVPWLALGTVYLLGRPSVARKVETGLVLFSGVAIGAVLTSPFEGVLPTDQIPVGRDHFAVLPRVLAAVGSGMGALVLIGGALWSIVRYRRAPDRPGARRMVAANALIALGTLTLSSGGLIQGVFGDGADAHDQAFAVSLASGIAVIYCGFGLASRRSPRPVVEREAATAGA